MNEQKEILFAKRDELKNSAKVLKAKDLTIAENLDALNKVLDEIEATDKAIDAIEKAEKIESQSATAVNSATESKDKFNSFGEFLNAVKVAGKTKDRVVDKRLVKDAIKGVNETTDADGGYAVQSDYLGVILDGARERSQILQRCRNYTVANDANRINYITPDLSAETSANAGTVVAGGVQAYWVDEGGTVTATKPKFKNNEIKLGKIMGIAYVTEEMLQDAAFMPNYLEDSFSEAVAGLLTDGVINGAGESVDSSTARQPLGIMNSSALVSVAMADTATTNKKLKAQDFLNMKSAMRNKNWANAVWFIHPDYEADLPLLVDDSGNQLFMPAGGISGGQYDTILGRPVVYDEFVAAKGSYGAILLADMSEYMLISKGNERKEWSMHVEFLTDQQCFRIILRVGGAPVNNTTYTVRHSSQKRGAFVTLGTKPTKV